MVYKMNESIIVIQAEATSPNRTNVVFWSHDRGTAKLRMKLVRKNGIPQSLPEGTTVPIRLMFKSATAEGGYGKHDYLATIEDPVNGIVSIVLEDNILGYVGTVEGSVYIDFPNDRSLDTAGRFTFYIKRSPIDDSTPELEDYYFNGFSQTIDKIEKILADGKQEIDQKITESETQIDAKVKDTNDKITKANQDVATINTNIDKTNDRIDQTNQKIAAVLTDVNKYNIDKTNDRIDQTNQKIDEVLSGANEFRTDIDTLKINKADKTFVDAQLAKKATKGEIGLSDLDKNKTQLDETWIADSLKQQIVGNAPIHSEPLNDSVINAHLADKSVYMNTLSLPDATYLPNTLTFESGTPTSTGITNSTTRGVSTVHTFKKGDTVKAVTSDVEFSVYKRNGTGGFTPVSGGWFTNQTIQEDIEGVIYSRFKDDRNLSDLTQQRLMGNSIIIDNDDVAARKRELKDITQRFFTDFEMGFFGPSGTFTSDDNRVRTPDYITIKADTTIKLADPDNTDYAVLIEGSGHYISGGWSKEPIYFSEETRILVGQRYSDNRVISISDFPFFSNNFIRLSDDSLLRLRDLKDVLHVPSNTQTTVFVTLNGDDNNHGMSSTSPLATLQKALDTRASVIYVERGVYYNQSIDADVDKVKILPLDNDSWDSNERSPVQKIEFRGSDKLDNSLWETYNSIYRQPYDGNGYFRNVFIDKTSPPETASSRPSYNAVIWEKTNELENDYKMKPVLTLGECENEQGTFYYDGSYVYVNPIDINNDFHSITLNRGLSIKGNSVELHDVVFNYYMSEPMNLDNIKHLRAQNCEANYSGQTDGFSLDYTNGELTNCLAAKNRNDGFNLHFYGDTVLTNCSGLYNYDDGISHHEGCTGVINGGKWIGNGKGGVAPAYGCKVNWNNCLLKGNGYGAYHQHRENDVNIHNVSSGNLYVDNGVAILNHYAELTSFNDTFINNQTKVAGNGVTNVY